MLKRFISYYKPHKLVFSLDMTASFLMSLIGILYPVMTRKMISEFTSGNYDAEFIIILGCILLGIYVVKSLLNYFVEYFGHMMGVKMQAQMRTDMFTHLEKLPFTFYDNNETGKIMSRITSDLFEVSELAHHGPENLIISSISIIISFVYLCTINVPLTLIVFICVPVFIFIALKMKKRMNDAFTESRKAIGEINAAVESSVSGIRVTKAFDNAEIESEKFEKGNGLFAVARKKAYKAMASFHSSTQLVTNIFNVVILIAGGIFLYRGEISVADYSAYIVSVSLFITPVNTLVQSMEVLEEGATGFKRFCEIMDTEPETEPENAVTLDKPKGDIVFDSVSCDYGNGREVLHNVSLTVKSGETFALVGPSGGGKTTLCHLLPHFYSPSSGKITIDGIDISGVSLSSLRRNIGIVQQDVYLFNASLRENILYGRPDATEGEVINAAKLANIHDFIVSLPDGYETVIGERGVKLSGGQKQRLSIARVFLKNPPILILDEATSALDTATEILIQSALDELSRGRTTIVVAHRLSTVRNAHRIAVVSEGEIAEEGTHGELMEKNGLYASLYSVQFKG